MHLCEDSFPGEWLTIMTYLKSPEQDYQPQLMGENL